MTFQERFRLIPPCLRDADGGATRTLDGCLLGSLSYYIELLIILVAVAAFFYIVYAGIQMATAFGNEGKYTAAKNTLLHAIIGIIVASMAYTIVSFTTSFFGVDGPKIYNPNTGEGVNNPDFVQTKAVIDGGAADPGNGDLTEDELFILEQAVITDTLTAGGTYSAIYLLSDDSFEATLILASGETENATVGQLEGGRYWARLFNQTVTLRGATLRLTQQDPATGFSHTKDVRIR